MIDARDDPWIDMRNAVRSARAFITILKANEKLGGFFFWQKVEKRKFDL